MKKEKKVDEEISAQKTATKKQSLFSRLKSISNERRAKKIAQIESEKLSEEENKKIEEKLELSEHEITRSKDKRRKIRNIIFFIFNVVLVAGILIFNIYTSEDFSPLKIFEIDFRYVFLTLLLLACVIFIDVISIHRMLYRKTARSRWILAYKSLGILRYYDKLTPMSTGGQPFMIAHLTSRDVPGSTALSIPMAKLVFQQLAYLVVSFVCLIVFIVNRKSQIVPNASMAVIITTSILGFALSSFVIFLVLFLSLSKKSGSKFIAWGLGVLVKLRILKDYDRYYEKVMTFVEDYQNIMKEYSRAKWDVVLQLFLHFLKYVCFYSIPFFIYCSFESFDASKFAEFYVFTAMIELSASFIPLPGGTGMNEITFTALFSRYLGGSTFWALIMWRFCSYYIYLLQGLAILAYDTMYGNRKYRWVKKRMELQDESQKFRQEQIENFRLEREKRRKKQRI